MEKKRLTIRDIAKIANVSHTTVSRVINRDSRVREESRNNILRIVKEMNFRPNPRARALVCGESRLIGVILADILNPGYAELAKGISEKTYDSGYNVLLASMNNRLERLKEYVDTMMDVGVDGLIFACVRLKEPVVEKLINERFPLVMVNRKLIRHEYNYVVLNNFKGAYAITEHLANLGYRQIAAIMGPSTLSTAVDRLNGYKKALKEYGLTFNKKHVIKGPFTRITGYEGGKKLLSMKERPEAIFAGNDYIAMGVIDAADELGIRVPEDIGLGGFDNAEFASNSRLRLTTVDQRTYEMGSLGVQILIDVIERKETNYLHKIILEPKLVIRESCGNNFRQKA